MGHLQRRGSTPFLTPLTYAYRLLARRAYSRREMQEKLEEKGFTAQAIDQTLSRLQEQGYLNDVSLAQALVQRLRERGYGRLRIREKLFQRKLPAWLIEETAHLVGSEEEKQARLLLQKHFPKGLKDRRLQAKAFRFLVNRGYATDLALTLAGAGEESYTNNKEDPGYDGTED